jgi:rod shape-determining protein MreD
MLVFGNWPRIDLALRRLTPLLLTLGLVILSQVPMQLPAAMPISPGFAVIAVYFWALHQPDLIPAPAVFAIGIFQDILGGLPIGLNAFIFLVLYGIVVSQRRYFFGKSFGVLWWGFATVAVVMGALEWVLMSALSARFLAVMPIVVEQLTTAALYPVVAYVFVLTHRSILREA